MNQTLQVSIPSAINRRNDNRPTTPDEMRFFRKQQEIVDPNYISFMVEAEGVIKKYLQEALLDQDGIRFVECLKQAHGISEKLGYGGRSGVTEGYVSYKSGEFRIENGFTFAVSTGGTGETEEALAVVPKLEELDWGSVSLPMFAARDVTREGKAEVQVHFVPVHFSEIETRLKAVAGLIHGFISSYKANTDEQNLHEIARIYQNLVITHAFPTINNSLFMIIINLLLEMSGLGHIFHGRLDYSAAKLCYFPEVFAKHFAKQYQSLRIVSDLAES